jgi:broad specificity phosphatase PhoE
MPRFLIALFIGFMFVSAACTETVTNTIIERDTVTLTVHVHDTVTIPEAINDTLTTVIALRHAETIDNTTFDPGLNDEGKERAAELVRILENVQVSHIYTTPLKRARETAVPLANKKNIIISEYSPDTQRDVLTARILAENPGKVAVVIGHSNTIPALLQHMSKNTFGTPIPEFEYNNLFIASLHADVPRVLHLKYGK